MPFCIKLDCKGSYIQLIAKNFDLLKMYKRKHDVYCTNHTHEIYLICGYPGITFVVTRGQNKN